MALLFGGFMEDRRCFEIFKKCFPQFTCNFDAFKKLTRVREPHYAYRYVDDKIVGFCYYHKNKISLLCVDPEYQNKGYGSSLLLEAEKAIKDAGNKEIVLGRSKILLATICTEKEYYDRAGVRFFKRRGYTSQGYYEDMFLDLKDFDINNTKYNEDIDSIEFKYYDGSMEDLHKAVARVEKGWVDCFGIPEYVFVAMKGDKICSFCNISPNDVTRLSADNTVVGNIGCVGTVPEMRKKGIGLTLVAKATQILKDKGTNVVHIHYTGVAPWYRKLGYETYAYWWFAHKKTGTK